MWSAAVQACRDLGKVMQASWTIVIYLHKVRRFLQASSRHQVVSHAWFSGGSSVGMCLLRVECCSLHHLCQVSSLPRGHSSLAGACDIRCLKEASLHCTAMGFTDLWGGIYFTNRQVGLQYQWWTRQSHSTHHRPSRFSTEIHYPDFSSIQKGHAGPCTAHATGWAFDLIRSVMAQLQTGVVSCHDYFCHFESFLTGLKMSSDQPSWTLSIKWR